MEATIHKIKTKQKFVPYLSTEENLDNLDELIQSKSLANLKEGNVVKGIVVGLENDTVIVDVGLKNEGRIPLSEFKLALDNELPEIGEVVDVYIEKIEGRHGRTILSREKAIREESWHQLEESYEKGELVDGVIFGRVKGGFTVDLSGVVAFLPGSQVDIRPIKDFNVLMDIVQPFKILKMDRKLGNVVVSRRAILEDSRSDLRDEMLAQIKEGMVIEGLVKNITDYGAFVDLGSLDGLLHVTDISWSRINHPSEVLSIGQKIKVIVTKFNEENKRISLGMKQLDENPWKGVTDEFPVGKKMLSKVSNVTDYGAFIELKNGIEGLVHSSEIDWVKSNQNAKKTLTIGQEVEFIILEVDEEKHRISLSIKQCKQNPWHGFENTRKVGDILKTKIRNITDFGLFVALGEEIDGMIHESDIPSDKAPLGLKSFSKGDEVECRITAIDVDRERVSLSMKLSDDKEQPKNEKETKESSSKYTKGAVITAIVSSIKDDGIEVTLNDGLVGHIKKTELAADKGEQKPDRFNIGDKVDAQIATVDKTGTKVTLSIKAHELNERNKTIKEYGSTDSGATLGQILGAALNQVQDSEKK